MSIDSSFNFKDLKFPRVFLDVKIQGKNEGKIVIELFDKFLPKTCSNFRKLCEMKKYQSSKILRIMKKGFIQGGDFENNNGSGGKSSFYYESQKASPSEESADFVPENQALGMFEPKKGCIGMLCQNKNGECLNFFYLSTILIQ